MRTGDLKRRLVVTWLCSSVTSLASSVWRVWGRLQNRLDDNSFCTSSLYFTCRDDSVCLEPRGGASYIRRRCWWRCVISTWLCICDACLACCVSRVSAITEYRQLPASCRPDFLYFVWKKQTLGHVLGRHFKFFKLQHQVATWTPCPQSNSIIIFVSQDTASYIHKWCRELLD